MAGLRLAAACAQFWELHAYGNEGAAQPRPRRWPPRRRNAAGGPRLGADRRLASLLFIRSDFPAMRRYAEEALALWRQLGQQDTPAGVYAV